MEEIAMIIGVLGTWPGTVGIENKGEGW